MSPVYSTNEELRLVADFGLLVINNGTGGQRSKARMGNLRADFETEKRRDKTRRALAITHSKRPW